MFAFNKSSDKSLIAFLDKDTDKIRIKDYSSNKELAINTSITSPHLFIFSDDGMILATASERVC